MKKMKKQFLSLFVLLCMIISMFPTTALAANIIDVSGNVTITKSDEELTCADNLYYGEVNVNGSATESKTRLTHPVLPLIQWQYGNNTYQQIKFVHRLDLCQQLGRAYSAFYYQADRGLYCYLHRWS